MPTFPASPTSLICKMPFAMTSHNSCLVAQAEVAICNDVSRLTGCVRIQLLLFDLSCSPGSHNYRNYGKPTHLVTFAVFLLLQLCILYYSMCFCSLLYDALWLGRDALWPEQFTLWLWLRRDVLWPQQFTKSCHTSSCFLRNANMEARGCYAMRDYMYGGD